MDGNIVLRNKDERRTFALGKVPVRIGSSAAVSDLVIPAPGIEPAHVVISWEPRASTWLLRAASAAAARSLRVNGRACPETVALGQGDVIGLPGGAVIRFSLLPAVPVFRGRPVREIPLAGIRDLVFGRATGEAADGAKVALDAEDGRISRQHLELEQPARGVVFVADRSREGTLLNGRPFDRRQLIVGDRLTLGAYNFEFTGSSLRMVATHGGARIQARDLSVVLKNGRRILNGVSLDIEPCRFVGILGGSGQGKTTLLNALCGVNPATGGEVWIGGARVGNAREMAAAGIGYVPQDDIVHRELTVAEALTYSARLKLPSGTPRRALQELVDETIERLGLSAHKRQRIAQLSGGQRKRVSIATELLAKPGVLFLDEPSSGLDPQTELELMNLLRRLASSDCTVVCTTHVLSRAHAFDQLCFVHDGHLIFNGTPDEAVAWFKVAHGLDEIYRKVTVDASKSGADWALEFANAHTGPRALVYGAGEDDDASAPEYKRRRGPGYPAQLRILLRRQWSILRADHLNLVFLLAQPLFIGLLIGWVTDDEVLRLFLCVVATLWFGCSNGAQQIVRELAVFRRERVCGLGRNAYLQSKYVFLTFVTVLQALLLLVVTLASAHVFNPSNFDQAAFRREMEERFTPKAAIRAAKKAAEINDFEIVSGDDKTRPPAPPGPAPAPLPPEPAGPGVWVNAVLHAAGFFEIGQNILDSTDPGETRAFVPGTPWRATRVFGIALGLRLAALLGAACAGVAIGLAISSLVRTETQAVMWVPLVLIPQILFGGFVVTRPEMSSGVRAAAELVPSFCAQRLMDVAGIYGQTTPRMSNRTKHPVFLTPDGAQEEITWTAAGEERMEKYDRISDWNKSWQNLLVYPSLAGRRRAEFETPRGVQRYLETVERRDDVRYPMGRLYLNTAVAGVSLAVLGGWIAGCYVLTLLGLAGKQKGR